MPRNAGNRNTHTRGGDGARVPSNVRPDPGKSSTFAKVLSDQSDFSEHSLANLRWHSARTRWKKRVKLQALLTEPTIQFIYVPAHERAGHVTLKGRPRSSLVFDTATRPFKSFPRSTSACAAHADERLNQQKSKDKGRHSNSTPINRKFCHPHKENTFIYL